MNKTGSGSAVRYALMVLFGAPAGLVFMFALALSLSPVFLVLAIIYAVMVYHALPSPSPEDKTDVDRD